MQHVSVDPTDVLNDPTRPDPSNFFLSQNPNQPGAACGCLAARSKARVRGA